MRHGLVLAAVLLPLAGCYVAPPPQPNYGYAAPAGPSPGYAPDAYPQAAYPPPGYDPYGDAYPGYSYNGGSPTMIVAGAVVPLVIVGGSWGYYDAHRGWHRAPDQVNRDVERQRAAGAAYHSEGGGYPQGRPPGGPGGYPQPRPAGGPEQYHGQPQYRPPPPPAQQARPAPQPQPQPQREEHDHGRYCPPGQHCS